MARHIPGFAGTRIEVAQAIHTTEPFTFGGWHNPTSESSTGGSMISIGEGHPGKANWTLHVNPSGTSDRVRLEMRKSSGPGRIAEKLTTVSINVWHRGDARIVAANDRHVYMDWDGTNHTGSNTFNATPNNLAETNIGRQASFQLQQSNGDHAWMYLNSEALTEPQLQSLSGNGGGTLLAPYSIFQVDPWSLDHYYPLLGGGDDAAQDLIGGVDMAAADTGNPVTHVGSVPTPGPHGLL